MQQRTCTVANCVKPPRSSRNLYCEMHYYRIRRHGDPLAVRVATGKAETSNGYALVYRPTHPLARTSGSLAGWVLEHRVILFERVGPGAHPCHWCAASVAWHKQYPRDADALVADHLDGDKLNNVPSNLVPACNPCNSTRAQVQA